MSARFSTTLWLDMALSANADSNVEAANLRAEQSAMALADLESAIIRTSQLVSEATCSVSPSLQARTVMSILYMENYMFYLVFYCMNVSSLRSVLN